MMSPLYSVAWILYLVKLIVNYTNMFQYFLRCWFKCYNCTTMYVKFFFKKCKGSWPKLLSLWRYVFFTINTIFHCIHYINFFFWGSVCVFIDYYLFAAGINFYRQFLRLRRKWKRRLRKWWKYIQNWWRN